MPITMSRAAPKYRRRGPLQFAATTPPTVAVAAQGGSSGSICPCSASAATAWRTFKVK